MNPNDYKGYVALGKKGKEVSLFLVPVGSTEAVVVATKEHIEALAKEHRFTIEHLIPAKVNGLLASAYEVGIVYALDPECYNFLAEAVDFLINTKGYKLARLDRQDETKLVWHVYAAGAQGEDIEKIAEAIAQEGTLVTVKDGPK